MVYAYLLRDVGSAYSESGAPQTNKGHLIEEIRTRAPTRILSSADQTSLGTGMLKQTGKDAASQI